MEHVSLLVQLLGILLIVILFGCGQILLDVFNLFRHQKYLGLSLSYIHCVHRVLLVQLDQGLLELDDVFVHDLNFLLDFLFGHFISLPRIAFAFFLLEL